jgi:hypothetical protein
MDGKIIVYLILLIAIITGVSGIYYSMDVDEAQKELILTQQQLGQTEETLKQTKSTFEFRKEAAAIITAAHIIERDNEAIRAEIRTEKQKRDDLAKNFISTIERVREDSLGLVIPEIPLTTGAILKNAKIQGIDADLTVIQHSEGVSKIPTSTLPASLLDRFRFGYNPGGVGSTTVIETTTPSEPATSTRKQPTTPSSSSTKLSTSASDSLARLGSDGPSDRLEKKKTSDINQSRDPNLIKTQGDPALWKNVERHSIGRAYVPGQGWLKIGPKGPIPGSGRK